ncbi:MAG: S8 family serine peptidase [Muribaculaceae bacterium]|nr:S8 family serine peptidase [Muribaculaceae bacterium]
MKKILLLSLAAAAALGSSAQSKLDLSAATLAARVMESQVQSRSGELAVPAPMGIEDKVSVIVTLAPGEDLSSLEARGYEIIASREDMAIVRMSAPEMLLASEMPEVRSISLSYDAQPLLFSAKKNTQANEVINGSAEIGGKSYDGTGVIVGLMDSGLDPNHPNFLGADGKSRASRVFVITGSNSAVSTYDTPTKIANFTTDPTGDTHGTHVLGCMAGSFGSHGEKFSKVAFLNSRTGGNQTGTNRWTSDTDYRGPAAGADIAIACGTTEGQNILVAAEKIYSYAKSQGKPAVMNISLGHNYGPHDGSDANSRYLSSVANDMIICVSAGNEGADNVSIHKDFTAASNQVKTFPAASATSAGRVDIWGADASIYKVTLQLYNRNTGKVDWSYTLDQNLNSTDEQSTMKVITGSYYTASGYIHNEFFDVAYGKQGAVFFSSKIDPNNNRYNVMVSFQPNGGSSAYMPGIVVEGTNGKSVDIFASGNFAFNSFNVDGYVSGSPANSINGIATAKGVIAVGAYTASNVIPSFGGKLTYRAYTDNDITDFSSYGTSFDGRQLPHVAGPGLGVVSSISSYYTEKLDPAKAPEIAQASGLVTKSVNKTNRNYYWSEMSGTSMASPFVAGVIATWLQADPTLTSTDVLKIIDATAVKDQYYYAAPYRFGAGRINALEGLKMVLDPAGVADVAVDASDFVVSPAGRRAFEVFAAGAAGIRVELYSLSGSLAATASAGGDTAVLDAEGAAPGVYVLRSTADNGRTDARKVVIR